MDHNYPFFTVVELNLNHNGDGTNAKHMDIHLAKYLEKIIRQPDVMTIINSDHGNRFQHPLKNQCIQNWKNFAIQIEA